MSRERCKQCGCFLAFDIGQEGDGDFYCNNQSCKVNTEDYRVNFEPTDNSKKFIYKNTKMADDKVYCEECLDKDIESVMILREGAYGDFYGCNRYPDCNYTLNERQFNLAKEEQNDR